MSLKPILDNIHILKNIAHMQQVLNMSCCFFSFSRVVLFGGFFVCFFFWGGVFLDFCWVFCCCFNSMSTVEHPKLFCTAMKHSMSQFYPSLVLKAIFSHQ